MIKNKAQDMKRYLSPDLNYVLEFGALASPLFETHSKALYCDHLERDELLLKYSAHSEDFKKNIVNTDFVWSGGKDLEVFEGVVGKIEIMGASHLIEHVPDLIGWLQRLQVLAADNCVLSLAVPIKTNRLKDRVFDMSWTNADTPFATGVKTPGIIKQKRKT
jgi:hypothetical protein